MKLRHKPTGEIFEGEVAENSFGVAVKIPNATNGVAAEYSYKSLTDLALNWEYLSGVLDRYQLVRPLPTFQIGDVFYMDKEGSLYLEHPSDIRHWRDKVVAYHKTTLEHFPEILTEWFMKI